MPQKQGKWTSEEHEEVAKAMAKYGSRVSGKQVSIEFVKDRTPQQINTYINRRKRELLATCKKYKQDYCDESEDDDQGGDDDCNDNSKDDSGIEDEDDCAKVYINDVNDNDILLGEKEYNKREGNTIYRDVVRKYQPQLGVIGNRTTVANMVADHIHNEVGGRFLKVDSTNQWHAVPHADVVRKIIKALVEIRGPPETIPIISSTTTKRPKRKSPSPKYCLDDGTYRVPSGPR